MVTQLSRIIFAGFISITVAGCSVFGNPGVEVAPYDVIESDDEIEVRFYKNLVLVSTSMQTDGQDTGGAFQKLFDYISGANTAASSIAMTAPVVTEGETTNGQKIAMTAPVFMDKEEDAKAGTMSFVLPRQLTLETAPQPTNPDVSLSKVDEMTVAVIRFNGLLRGKNIAENQEKLEQWITNKGYATTGEPKTAGYNPPWTLPNMRRNEILIPVRQ